MQRQDWESTNFRLPLVPHTSSRRSASISHLQGVVLKPSEHFTPWRHTGGIKVQPHSFLSSALDGGEWLTSRPGRFNSGKQPRYLLNRKLGRAQSRSGGFAEENYLLHLSGFPDRPARILVAIPNTLTRLLSGDWNSQKWYCETSVLTTHQTHFSSPVSSKRLMPFLTILDIYLRESYATHIYTVQGTTQFHKRYSRCQT